MTLWGLLIPGVLLLATAIASHCVRSTYWSGVRLAFVVGVAWLVPYWVALRLVFGSTRPFDGRDLLAALVFAGIGGGMGALCAMLVGLPIAADRRIAARRVDHE